MPLINLSSVCGYYLSCLESKILILYLMLFFFFLCFPFTSINYNLYFNWNALLLFSFLSFNHSYHISYFGLFSCLGRTLSNFWNYPIGCYFYSSFCIFKFVFQSFCSFPWFIQHIFHFWSILTRIFLLDL